ncbi:MAG: nitroreductase family protein [Spirochaetes bacterium]|nr:nitroreductase family protein [Spirochaetota bacterium]
MIEAIKSRRSIRKYKNTSLDDKIILELLESARLAPSGSNTQPWHFIIIKDQTTKARIVEAAHNQKWMLTAPVFIACVADIRVRITDNRSLCLTDQSPEEELKKIIRDSSIAIEHIVLEAESRGLGTCWMAWFTQQEIRPILSIPDDKYVTAILTLGYPDEKPNPRPRKSLEQILHYEKW